MCSVEENSRIETSAALIQWCFVLRATIERIAAKLSKIENQSRITVTGQVDCEVTVHGRTAEACKEEGAHSDGQCGQEKQSGDSKGKAESCGKISALSDFIDDLGLQIFTTDLDGKILTWSGSLRKSVGFTKKETIGKHFCSVLFNSQASCGIQEHFRALLETARVSEPLHSNKECTVVTQDGTTLEMRISVSPTHTEHKADGLVFHLTDLTARNEALAQRSRVAHDFERLIEQANAPIFGIDKNGNVDEWNHSATRMTGFSKAEVLQKNFVTGFVPEHARDAAGNVLMAALKGKDSSLVEIELFSKSGALKQVLLNVSTRTDDRGRVTGIIGVGQDITQRKMAEQELNRVAQDLERLIDGANAPIFGIDTDGNVSEWNQSASHITGYTKNEVLGKNLVKNYITEEYQDAVNKVLRAALNGQETANFNFPLFTKTGKRLEILLNASSRRDIEGKVIGVIGVGQDITERQAALQERDRVAQDLERLIDGANAPIFGIDTDGNVSEWNQQASKITGYTKSEVLGKNLVKNYISPDYQDSVNKVLTAALGGQETENFEFPLFTKAGQRLEILLNASSRRDTTDGRVIGVIGVGQDISQRKTAEQELNRVAQDLARLIDGANAPIFGIDTYGNVSEWNQSASKLTGYTKEEVLGKNLVKNYITPQYQEAVDQVLGSALAGEDTANFEFPLFTRHGRRLEILLNASSRRDTEGKVIGVIGVGQDITQRKTAEQELNRVAQDLERLIDGANAPIFGIDTDGNVSEWNQSASQITGYTKNEVLGKNLVKNYITEEYQDAVNKVLRAALNGQETANFNFPLFTKTGKRLEILLNASSRRDIEGKVIGVIGVGQDITERQAALQERDRVAQDLERLIDGANAPIFGIDTDGNVSEWNQQASKITGYTKSEVLGKNLVKNYISPQYQEAVDQVLGSALAGEDTANFEFPLFTRHGRRLEILLNASSRRDTDGRVIGVIGVGQDITQRKTAEQELNRVAQDLERLIDGANAPIFGIDTDGNVSEWNQSASQITGYTKNEVLGKNLVKNYITEEYQDAVNKVLRAALNGQETANFNFPLFTKTGKRLEILLNASSRRDIEGKVIGVIGVGQDITERQAALQERDRVAQDLERLIDGANAPIFGIDTDGNVSEWNQQASKITGYTKSEVLGKNLVKNYISPDYQDSVNKVLTAALGGQETENFEFPLFTKAGQRLEILLNASSRRDTDGRVIGVIGVGQDISQRKTAEQELNRVAQDLARLIDGANAPIFGIDTYGNVSEWNQSASKLTGYTKEEVLGKNLVKNYITPQYQEAVGQVLGSALAGEDTANFEFPLFTRHGRRLEILLNASSRRDTEGKVIGVIGVGQDITQRKTAEQELNRVAQDLERLIDGANAPIFGIDTDGNVSEWNQSASQITGYTKNEVLGKNLVKNYITEEYQDAVNKVLRAALNGQETANFNFPLFTKTGKRLEILLNASSRRDIEGKVIGVIGVGQDITERQAALQERDRVAQDLERLIDGANAPIFGIDTDGNVSEWNQQASKITGYTKSEVLGKNLVKNYISPDYQDSVNKVLTAALGGQETENFEFPLFTKAGQRLEILLNASSRRDTDGRVIGVIGVGQDISQRKTAEQELNRVAQDLARLIDGANAPIFGIDTYGNVSEWNQSASKLTGYTKEEVLGKNLVKNYITPQYQEAVGQVLGSALSGKDTANFEFPLFTRHGRRLEILLNASSRRDTEGKVIGVIGVGQDITQRKTAEQELNRVAQDLERLIDGANAPIFGIDTHGNVSEWNQSASQITGYTKDEVLGKNLVKNYITEEYQDAVRKVLHAAVDGQETANFNFPLFTKTGKRLEILLNASSRRDIEGKVIGVIGVGQDITERQAALQERDRVAQDLERLIDGANAPIFGIDTDGNVSEWNQQASKITGYTKSEVLGKNLVKNYISPDYQDSVNKVLTAALGGQETENFEFPLFTKAGLRLEILLNASSRRDTDGRVIGVIGVGQDISQRKTAEQELNRVAQDLARLIDGANAPIFGIDTYGNVSEWNQSASKLTGYTKEEVLGKNLVKNYITPQYQEAVDQVLGSALAGEDTANFEFPLFTRHGRRLEILLNASSRRDTEGKVIGVIGVGQDITQRKTAEQELNRVAQDLERLIDGANAPIFGIDTYGNVSEWNQSASQITGYTKNEVLGKSLVKNYITEEYQDAVRKVLRAALDGQETANFNFPLFTKTGKRLEILLNASSRRDIEGKVIGVIGVGQDITERQAALQERDRVAQDLERLIDGANAPIFGIDTDGNVSEWNQQASKITGYTKSEVLGKNLVKNYISPDYQDSVNKVLTAALGGQETENFEFPLFTKAGQRLEILLNASSRRDTTDGRVIGVIGVGQDITQRKTAEQELNRVAQDLARLIDGANAPIFGIDTYGNVSEWNQSASKLTGYTKEEVLGKNLVKNYITPQYQEAVGQVLGSALAGEDTANFEFPLFTRHGRRLEILLNASSRRDTEGKVIGVIGVGQDITQRKTAEQELNRVAQDLERLIDGANAPIFGIDTDGNVSEWNQSASQITGYTKDEVLGKNLVKNYITEEYQDAVNKVLRAALNGQETANFNFPLFTKTGKRLEILLNASSRRDIEGKVIGVIGVGQDITERQAALQERDRVAQDLERLIDGANAPIFGIDTHGNVSEWNQQASKITGYTKSEVLGKNLVKNYISPDYQDSVNKVLTAALGGQETENFEFPLFTKAGQRLEILLNASSRRDTDGRVIGVIGVGQDITQRKTAEQELNRVAQDLARLIDGANAPIFGIDTYGNVSEWNQSASKLTGYTKEEVLGKNLVKNYITPQYQEAVGQVLRSALSGKDTANFEFPLFTRHGRRLEILLNASSRRDTEGKVIGVIGVGQDITQRKTAEQELNRVAQDLERLIDGANAPIFGIDTDGNVSEWNQSASQITGYTKDEVLGKNLVKNYITEEYQDAVNKVLRAALNGQETANFNFPLFTKTGKRLEILLNASSRRDIEGKVIGVIGVGQDITERQAALQERDRVAQDLERLIDGANAPIFGIDTDGNVSEWNQQASKITGYTKSEVLGKNLVKNYISPDYQDSVNKVLTAALGGQETENFEFPLFTKAGQRLEILLNASSRRDTDGRVIGVIGVGQDISQRKTAEQELNRVAQDLARLIDGANAPIFGIDTYGNVSEWNQSASKLTGYTKEEVLGKNLVKNYITPQYQQAVGQVLGSALSGKDTANFEFPLFTRHGRRLEILLNASSRRDTEGKVIGVIGVGQDITQRKTAEQELNRVAQDLERLIDGANAPIFGIDTDGNVSEWNQSASQITGYTKNEVLGKNLVKNYITEEYQDAVHKVLRAALDGQETANFNFPLFTKTGKRLEILLNASSRRDIEGKVIGVIGVGQDITERQAALQERDRVAQDLERLIDGANAPIFGIDTHGNVSEWNQQASKITGYTKPEVLGKNLVKNYISPDYQDSVNKVLTAALGGQETENFEFPLFTKAGQRLEILLNASSRRDTDGRVIGVIGVGQDITQRKTAEQELNRVAQDLARLIDGANAPIFGIDTYGNVSEWNQSASKLTGYTKEEVLGKNLVKNYITPQYQEAVGQVLGSALAGEDTANFEFPLFTRHGRRLEILLNASSRRDTEGKVIGVIGVGQDITQRKTAEQELNRVAQDLERLIDGANAPIFGIDTDGNVSEWNQSASQITGYTKNEVLGKNLVKNYITEEYQDAVNKVLRAALNGQETANFNFPLFTKTGKRLEILLNASSRRDIEGKVIGVIGVGQDITERQAALQERDRVAQDLERLIDGANAPIFGIDTHGNVSEWNQQASKITGYTKSEVLGKNLVKNYISPDYQDSVNKVLTAALGGQETENFEFPLFTKAGQRLEILLNASSRRDTDGRVIGVIGVGQDITQRKTAEQELNRVAQDLARLIDGANAPIFGIDTYGNVSEWNQSASKLTGYTKEEVLGKNLVKNYITPQYQEAVGQVLGSALAGEDTANFEFPLFTRHGRRLEILLNASSRRDTEGKVIGVIGVGQDITQRKTAEQELNRVAQDLERLIDGANAPIFGIDTHGNVSEWNQSASQITGYTKDEVLGKNLVKNYITEEYQDAVHKVLRAALDGQETANFNFPLFTKTGKRLEILLNASSRRDIEGKVIGVIGVGQDITERQAALQERDRVAQDLERLIDGANAPIFGIDTDGNVSEWNQQASKITGYTKSEVLGKNLVKNYISPDYQDSVNKVLTAALGGQETENFEFPLFTKAGQRLEILLNASSRRDTDGRVIGVIGVGQDITQRKTAEQELNRVAQDLARLIDGANAPIFGIDTYGNVSEWNQSASKLTGYTKEEVLGKNLVKNYITPQYQEAVDQVLGSALAGEDTANFEFPLFTRHGRRLEILLNASSRRDTEGKVIGVIGVGQDITQRKTAEQELNRVAQDLERLIDGANAPIFGIDTDGNVSEWNQSASQITGYTKNEVLGNNLVANYISPDYQEVVDKVLKQALRGVETANFNFPLFTKTGKRLEILLNASSRRDIEGKVIGVIGVGQDITERQAALQERDRVAQDLERLIDGANAPIFGIDTEGNVSEWNQQASKITGYTKGEVLGQNLVKNYITVEYQEAVDKVLKLALAGQDTANFEFPLFTKQGRRVEILLNASCRQNTMGKVIGMVGVGQDITQRKAAEESRDRVAKDLERLIDGANAPILGIDRAGNVSEWNQSASELTGYSKAEVLGQNLVDNFILEGNRARVKSVVSSALDGKLSSSTPFTLFLCSKSGRVVECLFNVSTRFGFSKDITGVVLLGQDITRLRTAEKERDQAKTDYLAFICHELRNPLNGIAGMNELILDEDVNEHVLSCAKSIKACSNLMKRVVDDVLDFSKIENRQMPMEVVQFDLESTIASLIRSQTHVTKNSSRLDNRNVKFLWELDPGMPRNVFGDPVRYTQVVLNLLGNALKFTHQGSVKLKVYIENKPTKDDFTLSSHLNNPNVVCIKTAVIDTGVGISPSYQKNLFVAYSQEKASQQKTTGGTGLGLVICKEIVSQMGGKIHVDSDVGKGSTFSFSSPFYLQKPSDSLSTSQATSIEKKSFIGRQLTVDSNFHTSEADFTEALEEHVERYDNATIPQRPTSRDTLSTVEDSVCMPKLDNVSTVEDSVCMPKLAEVPLGPSKAAGRAKKRMKTGKAKKKSHVLVVEDNLINQKVAKNLLRKFYDVTLADNGLEGLNFMRKNSATVDLILMDVFMPVMNGHEATRKIREFWDGPIIALTANATAKDKSVCLGSGMTDVVTKPFIVKKLVQLIEGYIESSSTTAAEPPIQSTSAPEVPLASPETEGSEEAYGFSSTTSNSNSPEVNLPEGKLPVVKLEGKPLEADAASSKLEKAGEETAAAAQAMPPPAPASSKKRRKEREEERGKLEKAVEGEEDRKRESAAAAGQAMPPPAKKRREKPPPTEREEERSKLEKSGKLEREDRPEVKRDMSMPPPALPPPSRKRHKSREEDRSKTDKQEKAEREEDGSKREASADSPAIPPFKKRRRGENQRRHRKSSSEHVNRSSEHVNRTL
eukprot:g22756.t1